MPHNGNWKRFDFGTLVIADHGNNEAYFESLQKICRHPQSELTIEMDGQGDDVKIKTVCKLCLKTVSEE